MSCGIYRIHCKETNKNYIGQSVDIEKRWNEHIRELRSNKHGNYKLQNDWNELGEEKFSFSILKEDDEEFLNILEKHFIQVYDSISNGYNIRNENGIIKQKFLDKYKKNDIVEILENTPIDLNITEVLIDLLLNLTSHTFNECTCEVYYGKQLLKELHNDYYDFLWEKIVIKAKNHLAYKIIYSLIDEYIEKTLGKYINIKKSEAFISLYEEDDSEDYNYAIELLEIILNIFKNKTLPLHIEYYDYNNKKENIYVTIPINDVEAKINKTSLHNMNIQCQIEELQKKNYKINKS